MHNYTKKAKNFIIAAKKRIPKPAYNFFLPMYHFCLAFCAAVFYGFPSRRLKVIGVTGTKGKTSTVEFVHAVLEFGGYKTASLSSLRFKIGRSEKKNMTKMTMPGRFFVQRFLHNAAKSGCTHVVLEVTSEGIKQSRHRFINFAVAVMTNVSPEHLESHGGFERYLRAKLDLFHGLSSEGSSIVNRDDPNAVRFFAATGSKKIQYGKNGIDVFGKFFPVKDIEISEDGIRFRIGGTEISSRMLGEFNFYNILAAISVGLREHISLEKIKYAIENIGGIPGRLEFVQKSPFAVVVDYAHTPGSLLAVYTFLKERLAGKLICVLGSAGGGRDKWKRPELGRIAAESCDSIFLTNEDPYDENPRHIIDDIFVGIAEVHRTKIQKIIDRREAIFMALKEAREEDTVIITGKGAESWIMEKDGKTPWDDREVVREELKKI